MSDYRGFASRSQTAFYSGGSRGRALSNRGRSSHAPNSSSVRPENLNGNDDNARSIKYSDLEWKAGDDVFDVSTSSSLTIVVVHDIPVSFPFPPYPTQVEYMAAVIQALQNRQNALLESPTGTGKTLSLLCSALAWRTAFLAGKSTPQNSTPSKNLKIIFASRTHDQLKQVMTELRRTAYRNVSCGMLASRDQLCINQEILRESEKSHAKLIRKCKAVCSTDKEVDHRNCQYFTALQSITRERTLMTAADIEDIASKRLVTRDGQRVCPFHAARHASKTADLLFMPYTYLFDLKSGGRSTALIPLEDAVVIIDEGHNIAQICEAAATFEFRVNDVLKTAQHVSRIYQKMAKIHGAKSVQHLGNVHESLMQMYNAFQNFPVASTKYPSTMQAVMDRILRQTDITYSNIRIVLKALDVVLECETSQNDSNENSTACIENVRVALLMLFFPHGLSAGGSTEDDDDDALPNVVDVHRESRLAHEFYKSYLVTVADVPSILSKAFKYDANFPKMDKIIRCFCLSPHNALRSLISRGIRSLIITSGTLSPMNLLAAELGITMHVQKTCPHIIKSSQISGLILSHAPSMPTADGQIQQIALKADFTNRDNIIYHLALGEAVLRCVRCVPAGVLVFFSSYAALDTSLRLWREHDNIMPKIEQFKAVFVEERDRDRFCAQLLEFRRIVREDKRGAILFAVSRAKVSEGIDFPDDCARAVIVVGIPYGHIKDERTMLKKLYLNRIQHDPLTKGPTLSGSEWYQRDAWVSINQSIGRVIRHRTDYGVCILLDERILDELQRVQAAVVGGDAGSMLLKGGSNLPPYIRDSLASYTLESAVVKLQNFFAGNVGVEKC